jgi:hypothetical protein
VREPTFRSRRVRHTLKRRMSNEWVLLIVFDFFWSDRKSVRRTLIYIGFSQMRFPRCLKTWRKLTQEREIPFLSIDLSYFQSNTTRIRGEEIYVYPFPMPHYLPSDFIDCPRLSSAASRYVTILV